jgi:isopentenyldiphosphate isomerase
MHQVKFSSSYLLTFQAVPEIEKDAAVEKLKSHTENTVIHFASLILTVRNALIVTRRTLTGPPLAWEY